MIYSNDGRVSIASTPPQSITAEVNWPIESFNMLVISIPQEAQVERCSPLQCGAQRPTALSITLTEASVLSVPLWHPPQSTEDDECPINSDITIRAHSLSWTPFVLVFHSIILSLCLSLQTRFFLFISLALFLYEVSPFSAHEPPIFLSSVYNRCNFARLENKFGDKSRIRHKPDYSVLKGRHRILSYHIRVWHNMEFKNLAANLFKTQIKKGVYRPPFSTKNRQCFRSLKTQTLKTSFKVQVFKNNTIIAKMRICENIMHSL